jgi:two-component system, cell cycle sensor histidine kinase and response regulator CckA
MRGNSLFSRLVVLLVDDEPQVRKLLRIMLETQGCTVVEARDGREALEILERDAARVDLVLSDVTMPRLNGFQLARELALARPEMKILLMTGYTHVSSEADAGFRLLYKPFGLQELVRAVSDLFAGRGAGG